MIHFFLQLEPDIPTLTHQHGIAPRRDGKGMYKTLALRQLEQRYENAIRPFVPEAPLSGPVFFSTLWFFARPKKVKKHVFWKDTRPDTDDLIKTFKDCFTRCGFWNDDAQVALETIMKAYAPEGDKHGIEVKIIPLVPDLYPLGGHPASLFKR